MVAAVKQLQPMVNATKTGLSEAVRLECVILPFEKELSIDVPHYTTSDIQAALAKELKGTPESFVLLTKKETQLVSWTPEASKADTVFALVRCRAAGKGGFRKQLEKKGREFARAKMKEKRNSVKVDAAKGDSSASVKKESSAVKVRVPKAEVSATRTLVKQGIAFVVKAYEKDSSAA